MCTNILAGRMLDTESRLPREASSLTLEILKNTKEQPSPTSSRSVGFAQENCDRSPVKPSKPSLPVILWTCKDQTESW